MHELELDWAAMLRSVALQVWLVQAAAQRNYRPILKLREKGRRCEMGIKKGAGRDGLVTTKSGGARLASFMQARVEGRGRGESVATVQSDHGGAQLFGKNICRFYIEFFPVHS